MCLHMLVTTCSSCKMLRDLSLLLLIAVCLVNSDDAENPTVSISLGQVKGSTTESRLGKRIYSFRGLRYAEGPIGPLRFKVSCGSAVMRVALK